MNKDVQKTMADTISDFEAIVTEAAFVANEMLSLNPETVNHSRIIPTEVFVERGKLYVICDTWLDASLQVHIPLEFLLGNEWQEGYAAKFVQASDKKTESIDAMDAAEELMLRERIGKVTS